MLLRYLTSGKRLKRQRSLPASTGLALRSHIKLINLKGMLWAKISPSLIWVRFMFSQCHLL